MKRTGTRWIATVLLAVLCTAFYPGPALAAGHDESHNGAESPDAVMEYYEQHREYASALGIAIIDLQDTGLYYLGGIRPDANYVYEWGSCTKVITWVCVMQLVEQGKIDLDADIRTYLPAGYLTRLKYDAPVTMLNLMNHDAGFQEILSLFVEDPAEIQPLWRELKENQPPQIWKPGDTVAYSNFGAALAGYIVECVSGEDYCDYVAGHIFVPLGMEHTAIRPDQSDNDWVSARRRNETCCFIAQDGGMINLGACLLYTTLYPAGAACGTIEDFSRFVRALIPDGNGRCLLFEKDGTLSDLYEPTLHYADGKTARNAHGMWAYQFGNGLFGHGGNSAGFSSIFVIDPVAQKACAIMTNVAGESVFNYGLLPVIFGDYQWDGEAPANAGELSGLYYSSRGYYPHSFLKINCSALLGVLNMKRFQEDFTITWISDRVFLAGDRTSTMTFFITDDGTLQSMADDLQVKSATSYYFEVALLILYALSALYAFAALTARGLRRIVPFMRKKASGKTPPRSRRPVPLACMAGSIVFMLLMLALSLLSGAPLPRLLPTLAVFGCLATAGSIAAFILGVTQFWKNADVRRSFSGIATLAASLIVLANVAYWELFNFWSL